MLRRKWHRWALYPPLEHFHGADAQRRTLTVQFCDLVGSTELSTRLDPEDLRDVISGYHRSVADTVARFDGYIAAATPIIVSFAP